MTKSLAAFAVLGLIFAVPASAQKMPKTSTPKIFEDVIQCRAITDEAARLACYDRGVAALQTAQQSNELYVADKQAMSEARRGLFGFSIPKLKIFGDDAEEIDEIETTIAAVRDGQRGLVFTLAEGGRWAQMDKKYMDRPKIGSKIKIEKGVMGSFMASINGKSGFRIERLND